MTRALSRRGALTLSLRTLGALAALSAVGPPSLAAPGRLADADDADRASDRSPDAARSGTVSGTGDSPSGAATRASFALIGDVPYGTGEEGKLERIVEAINASHAAGGVRLVVHTGDVKRGRERCDDALLQRRFELFQRFEPPFIITPGDNDWTDCHRPGSGGYLPTERLARFRQIFYPRPGMSSGRRPMPVFTQAASSAVSPAASPTSAPPAAAAHREYVENQLWAFAGTTMATLHVVGSGNGLEPWDGIDRQDSEKRPRRDRLAEFAAREAAALAWLDTVFAHAREHRSAGVMVAMQANPRLNRGARDAVRQGFNRILERLARHAQAFGKPVLLAHGDTHTFRFDRPLQHADADTGLPALENLARVENFGSPQVHWVEVRVDAGTPEVFSAVPHYLMANLLPF